MNQNLRTIYFLNSLHDNNEHTSNSKKNVQELLVRNLFVVYTLWTCWMMCLKKNVN